MLVRALIFTVAALAVAAPLVGQTGGRPSQVRFFDRVLLLEDSAATSANAALGDLDGDGDLDIVLAKGRHWPLHDRVLLNDGRGGAVAASSEVPNRARF